MLFRSGNELLLNVELARVRDLRGAFAPIVVEGRLTPESVEGGHLIVSFSLAHLSPSLFTHPLSSLSVGVGGLAVMGDGFLDWHDGD